MGNNFVLTSGVGRKGDVAEGTPLRAFPNPSKKKAGQLSGNTTNSYHITSKLLVEGALLDFGRQAIKGKGVFL